jgi:hypothetical protein
MMFLTSRELMNDGQLHSLLVTVSCIVSGLPVMSKTDQSRALITV